MPGKKIGGKLSAYLRRKQESRPPNPSNTYEPLSDAHAAYLKDLSGQEKRTVRVKFSVRPNMDTN